MTRAEEVANEVLGDFILTNHSLEIPVQVEDFITHKIYRLKNYFKSISRINNLNTLSKVTLYGIFQYIIDHYDEIVGVHKDWNDIQSWLDSPDFKWFGKYDTYIQDLNDYMYALLRDMVAYEVYNNKQNFTQIYKKGNDFYNSGCVKWEKFAIKESIQQYRTIVKQLIKYSDIFSNELDTRHLNVLNNFIIEAKLLCKSSKNLIKDNSDASAYMVSLLALGDSTLSLVFENKDTVRIARMKHKQKNYIEILNNLSEDRE